MKTQLSTPAMIAIIVVAVIGIVAWGMKQMQPASYVPSPGVGGTPAVGSVTPGQPQKTESGREYPTPPPGSTPGQPSGGFR